MRDTQVHYYLARRGYPNRWYIIRAYNAIQYNPIKNAASEDLRIDWLGCSDGDYWFDESTSGGGYMFKFSALRRWKRFKKQQENKTFIKVQELLL
jgi:hypothetical protein